MIRYCCSILLLLMFTNIPAQNLKTSDTSFATFLNRLPAFCQSAENAWQMYYPKNKTTPCKQYQLELEQQLNLLLTASNHKSRLLSMLAGKYEQESGRYDFSKVKIEKDPVLDAAVTKMSTVFFSEQDNYLRGVNSRSDSAYQQLHGQELAAQLLRIHQQEFSAWLSSMKKQFATMNNLMITKGYLKVLTENNTTHPYYTQLLEVKGLLLDRLVTLSRIVDGANQLAASLIDDCKKNPESCK